LTRNNAHAHEGQDFIDEEEKGNEQRCARKEGQFIHLDSLMIVSRWIFRRHKLGNFICQLVWFMDQDRQALRADINLIPLKFERNERSLLFRRAAVQTD
jgi:hypothetical protein